MGASPPGRYNDQVLACPSCRRLWPDGRDVCPRCLAALIEDLDATIACTQCGHVCPARMQSCSACFALLREEDRDLALLVAHGMAHGNPLRRPVGRPPFASGHACTVLRLGARTPLVLAGPDGFVEASVSGADARASVPLSCSDAGRLLFRLEAYAAADAAVVAIAGDGAPRITCLRRGALWREAEVRDETSAPVARITPGLELVETGGRVLGHLYRVDVERDGWIDDQWTLSLDVAETSVPLQPLALPALVLAAKVLLGRPCPVPAPEQPDLDSEPLRL
jgi:RNA polymerase subunit RPABC4/transcription elongation factor Spt4